MANGKVIVAGLHPLCNLEGAVEAVESIVFPQQFRNLYLDLPLHG
ncbi:hypothetical protein J2Z83_002336 [Virgibacillus natechei]|uniref:Uncharacterized protein n=1 Tax=Virgibacillus natechei TaxID=1216297 RepID=A0ABS4IGZ8_9BACI|nr:hypothetical protein [Virgibacillus natechei]